MLSELGAGGMGTVFLAERDVDGTAQRVALKLLHGVPTLAEKRRMRRERALLAGLNHPQIAKHLDGGETEQGQPFLVMDYVEGSTLPDYIAAQPFDPGRRLELFRQLCMAAQHAHQRLILHRDIKPSNVIVRHDGSPVLLDFGVGKLIGESLGDHATVTVAFTPGYGAPEQRRGEEATTSADVFGLGTVLFDLLTDVRLSTVRKGDAPVPAPSAHAQDRARRLVLRGDLDRIVLKACAERPEDRYATATALADDIAAYLEGRPISAAPDRVGYRLRRFVGRHRLACAVGVGALVLVGVFVVRLDVERQRSHQAEIAAEREARYAHASRDFLVSVLGASDPSLARGKPITVGALLSAATQKLARNPPEDRATRAIAWLTVAEVYASLNDPQPGLRASDIALSLLDDRDRASGELRARALSARGKVLTQLDRHREALATMQQMVELRERLHAGPVEMARAYGVYGATAEKAAEFDSASRHMRRALAYLDQAGVGDSPDRASLLIGLLGMSAARSKVSEAQAYFGQADTAAKASLGPDDPLWFSLHKSAARLRYAQHRAHEERWHTRQALEIAHRIYGENSRLTADAETYMAMALIPEGDGRNVSDHLQRARAIMERIGLDERSLAENDSMLATHYLDIGDYPRSLAFADDAIARLPTDEPGMAQATINAHVTRARALLKLGREVESDGAFERALDMTRRFRGEGSAKYAWVALCYAEMLIDTGRLDEGERNLELSRAGYAVHFPGSPSMRSTFATADSVLARKRGDLTAARRHVEVALQYDGESHFADRFEYLRTRVIGAEIFALGGDTARAHALLAQAIPALERGALPTESTLVHARALMARLNHEKVATSGAARR
ncbi:serine/threonine-protein kinase [Lysobacter capsici]|uniref:serine/threonine-protein kinase n=1 Tax=Lysobacter capsici TaxID=435897 RepID=UPI001C008620|nr:serine/threonine-protein kinase [Lysobacter capsici]QWF16572.1 protein kinase [Lysobacter capsici]